MDIKERTEVLTDHEDIDRAIGRTFSNILKDYGTCIDSSGPLVVMGHGPMKRRLVEAQKRGIKIRFLTQITSDNLQYCRQMMELGEMRHLEGIQGNFGVSETEYLASATLDKEKLVPILIYSNVRQIVKQEQFIFETLWNRAIPAEQRIEEIENGKEHEFLEVCPDRFKAAQVYSEFAGRVEKEALLILPNAKALLREYDLGILHKLVNAAANNKATVRIICPIGEENKNIAQWLSDTGGAGVRLLDGDGSDSTILLVDDRWLFRAELKNDSASKFPEAIGYALYSNSKPTVNSFKSFFEMLWDSRLLAQKLKEADRLQREFIHVAAHELRTPIQPILGMAELIESAVKEKGSPPVKPEEIEMIARNARRLYKLSEDILDIARIESNSLTLHKSKFNLGELLTQLVMDSRKQIEMDGRNIMVKNEPTDVEIYADKERIMQVLGNLLNNALKFTGEGMITVSAKKENDQVLVAISDTGKGIEPGLLPLLFTKFVTRSEKGTGLGLYISKAIIKAHGGEIWAENNIQNQGSTFRFTLPAKD